MAGKIELHDIANLFAGKYNNLYNLVLSEPNAMNNIVCYIATAPCSAHKGMIHCGAVAHWTLAMP